MDKKNILIILLAIVCIALIAIVASVDIDQDAKTNINNITAPKNTTDNTTLTIVSVEWVENYQAGDGSIMKEVTYSDGNIRQYDIYGNLIGSTFPEDQQYLPSME